MKRNLRWIVLLVLAAMLGSVAMAEDVVIQAAVLKGPTGMGAAYLIDQNEQGLSANQYTFTIESAPDAVVGKLITGELNLAALPTNTIAMLYQKTEGEVQSLAINTLGVLYVLERGDSVHGIDDLAGKTIIGSARGSTAEAVAEYLFPEDATVEYASEHAEAVAQAVAGQYDLVLLPEPFVTSLLAQDDSFRIAIDLTAAWEEKTQTSLPMGGIAVRADFAAENPQAVRSFLEEYARSVAFAVENPQEAAALIEKHDIMTAAVAEKAIPRANMVCVTGAEMETALNAFYAILLDSNPDLIGGAMPAADFYLAVEDADAAP